MSDRASWYPGITLDEACAVDHDWQKVKHYGEECARGNCAYAGPPDPDIPANGGCPGYRVTPSLEGVPYLVIRWGMCARHKAWWADERVRRKSARQRDAEQWDRFRKGAYVPPKPKGWRGDDEA